MTSEEKWIEELVEECVKKTRGKGMDEVAMFRAVTKSIAKDAGKVLDETWALWELEPDSKKIKEKFHLMEYYLSYLYRFCKGEV